MNRRISRRTVMKGGAAAATAAVFSRLALAVPGYEPAVRGRPVPGASAFGATSTAEEVTAGMDLSGMTALVTGCNSGIGYETMRVLALRGAHVIGAARTQEKADKACASVEGNTTPLVVELTDLPGIVTAAEQVDVPVDMLILNAGIMALPERRVVNGVEMQFAVNHLGHFLLTSRLLDKVVAAKAGRVVVVSSGAHFWAPDEGIEFDNLDAAAGYEPYEAYGQSKLANNLFSRELARRLADTSATSNALHPGVIQTNLQRYLPQEVRDEWATRDIKYKSIAQGAATQCYVATSPDLDGVTGYYFSDCNPANGTDFLDDDELAARLWAVSEELVADYL